MWITSSCESKDQAAATLALPQMNALITICQRQQEEMGSVVQVVEQFETRSCKSTKIFEFRAP